jgi:predicted Zn-dependent peptidase
LFPQDSALLLDSALFILNSLYRVTQLPGGLRIATAEMPHMASVSLGIFVGIGSRYEPAPLNGVCHFIEHMLFKGTRRRSARGISEAVEGLGGYLNAFTSEESTCFHARAHHQHFDAVFDVLMDLFLNSRFAPADVAKEREVIKEEIAMYRDQPAQHVQEVLNATVWPNHPLGRSITGTNRTLNRLKRLQLLGFLAQNYCAGNTVVVAAGNLQHARVIKAVTGHAALFRSGPPPRYCPAETRQTQPRIKLISKPTEQAQMALAIRTCSRHDDRRFALRVLNAILGESMSSRLFQRIREDLGLAYNIYSTPSFYDDTGDIVISAGLDADNMHRALGLILRELRRFTQSPPGAAELQRARDFVIGQFDLMLESTENQMNFAGEQILGYGRIIPPELSKRRLAAVAAGEIRQVAADFFRPERVSLAIVSPSRDEAGLRKALDFSHTAKPTRN